MQRMRVTTDTVPSCLVVSAHTGPSLPPAPRLSASAASLLEANPAEKGQTQTFTPPVLPALPAAVSTGMRRLFYQERPTWGYSHMCWQPVQLRRSPRAGQEQVLIQQTLPSWEQIPQHAVINDHQREESEGPIGPGRGPRLFPDGVTHCYCHVTRPPGQRWRKAALLVEGESRYHAGTPHQTKPRERARTRPLYWTKHYIFRHICACQSLQDCERAHRIHWRTGTLVTTFHKWLKSQTDLFLAAVMQLRRRRSIGQNKTQTRLLMVPWI